MIIALLIVHGLLAVLLLGATTHQTVALFTGSVRRRQSANFVARYSAVQQTLFTRAIIVIFIVTLILGGTIYPAYRLDVRIPFEEMSLGWAVGFFELKEHLAGLGLGMLPLYAYVWTAKFDSDTGPARDRTLVTAFLTFVVWLDFLVGHVLNNIRGLG